MTAHRDDINTNRNESKVKLAFVTTCKNRYQHLEQTLVANLQDNQQAETKFIVLDYNSGDHMACDILRNHRCDIESGRLVYYRYRGDHPFKMAHAKNMAHRLGIREGADILCNLDADNYAGFNFDQYIQGQFARHDTDIFLWARMMKGILPKGISGRIVCTKDQFLNLGGYDEKYHTYSPDDKDFKARLIRMECEPVEIDNRFLNAIRHNDKMRFREYPDAADADAEDFQIDQWNRVCNNGNFGCGTVWRNFGCQPIELKPMPTRIFGVGMHKTATTSLHHALQILGFKSGHWKNAHWARAIWNQMQIEGRSLALEKYYALSDLPIPMLYRQLDSAYPGSKFVLTTRPENEWLESVKKHWNPKYNPQQPFWKNDPFTGVIHQVVYGQRHFDADVMLARYRKHNADVQAYFADRPGDLLVMPMSDSTTWDGLCGFLDVPVPGGSYPQRNVTVE